MFLYIYFPIILCSPFCGWAHDSFCLNRCKYSLLPFFLIHSLPMIFFIFRLFHSHIFVFTSHAFLGITKRGVLINRRSILSKYYVMGIVLYLTIQYVTKYIHHYNIYCNHKASYSHCKQYKNNLTHA